MKHNFIINPNAGKGKALAFKERIENYFDDANAYEIFLTNEEGDATRLAKEISSLGPSRIYAVGGDGTLNEVLNGMAESECALGIIPTGTGNDFAKYVFNSHPRSMEEIIEGDIYTIDIGKCNDRYFLNIGSVGIDADVCENLILFRNKKLIPSSMRYMSSILYTLAKFKGLKAEVNGQDKHLTLIAVANGRYYGGGIFIAPEASIQDGVFDVCEADYMSKRRMSKILTKMKTAGHIGQKGISIYPATSIVVESEQLMTIQVDGEVLKDYRAEFTICPNKIKWISAIDQS